MLLSNKSLFECGTFVNNMHLWVEQLTCVLYVSCAHGKLSRSSLPNPNSSFWDQHTWDGWEAIQQQCDQAGGQHEEEVPGGCGRVWFFHMLLRPLFVICCVMLNCHYDLFLRTPLMQSSKQHQTSWKHCTVIYSKIPIFRRLQA